MDNTTTAMEQDDNKLSLKKLQSHLIRTIIGALSVALVSAFITSYGFYYSTTDNINELNKNKIETKQDIKELKNDVNDIKTTLSNTTIYTNSNQDEIRNLKQDIKDIKKSQDEMLRLLYEMKLKK